MSGSDTLTPLDIVIGLLVAGVIVLGAAIVTRRAEDRKTIMLALLAKLAAAVAYVVYVVVIYGGGDTLGYHTLGSAGADAIRSDLMGGSFDSLTAALTMRPGMGTTPNLVNLSTLVHLVVFDSFLATTFVFALFAFIGQVLLYRAFVSLCPDPRLRNWWKLGVLFSPSLVFWSASLLKDPLGILGLGCGFWAAVFFFQRLKLRYLAVLAVGVYVLLLFRPQVLAALGPTLLLFALLAPPPEPWSVVRRRFQRIFRVLFVLSAPAAYLAVSHLSQKYSLSLLPTTLASESADYTTVKGAVGSTIGAVGLQGTFDISWKGLILASPSAILYTLFRPFPWEGHSPVVLLAVLENAVLGVFLLRAAILGVRYPRVWRRLVRSPIFLPSVVFVVVLAVVVGVATPNLGSVSRYRIPLLPFFAAALIAFEYQLLEARAAVRVVKPSTRPARPAGRQRERVGESGF